MHGSTVSQDYIFGPKTCGGSPYLQSFHILWNVATKQCRYVIMAFHCILLQLFGSHTASFNASDLSSLVHIMSSWPRIAVSVYYRRQIKPCSQNIFIHSPCSLLYTGSMLLNFTSEMMIN